MEDQEVVLRSGLGMLVTMDARQGVDAVKLLDPQITIPVHYNDYTVFKSPLADFQRLAREEGINDRMRYLSHGETYRWQVPNNRI